MTQIDAIATAIDDRHRRRQHDAYVRRVLANRRAGLKPGRRS